jgi:hypothetical protein
VALLGLDYAGGRPGGATIAAAGYGFVVRYLSSGGASLPGKLLTPEEYADLQAHGVRIVANWETTADRMKSGFAAGAADARAALAQLQKIGHPADRPVYFSCDFDATPADQAAINDYLHGAASVIGVERVGIYGGYWPVKRALDAGAARWAWQTGAWSGGNIDPRIHIYQRIGFVTVGGVQCDVNEARKDDFGQHPVPTKQTKGTEVGLQNFPLPAGEGIIKLICPVGSASAITAQAWISMSVIDGTGDVTVWVQRDNAGLAKWDVTLTKDQRWWRQLLDGTTQMTVAWKTTAPLGLALETQAK